MPSATGGKVDQSSVIGLRHPLARRRPTRRPSTPARLSPFIRPQHADRLPQRCKSQASHSTCPAHSSPPAASGHSATAASGACADMRPVIMPNMQSALPTSSLPTCRKASSRDSPLAWRGQVDWSDARTLPTRCGTGVCSGWHRLRGRAPQLQPARVGVSWTYLYLFNDFFNYLFL